MRVFFQCAEVLSGKKLPESWYLLHHTDYMMSMDSSCLV